MLGALWRQSKIELDEAFNKYESALKEAQKIANRVKTRNFPRQLATCETLKQEADMAKYTLMEFTMDLKKSILVTAEVDQSPHAIRLREWGFGWINEYRVKGKDLDSQYYQLLTDTTPTRRPASQHSEHAVIMQEEEMPDQ